jgi:hypothetical protein
MLGINIVTMDIRTQHRKNARDERLWMTEAREDKEHLHESAERLRNRGEIVRANFMERESEIAGSFMKDRKKILNQELKRSGY